MGDDFKKVQSGQSLDISARAYNAFVNAAIAQQTAGHSGGGAATPRQHLGNVLILNKTGGDLDEFSVVGLGSPIFEPTDAEKTLTFKAQVGFEGETPATASHTGKFAILLEPIADDAIGIARLSGVCPVKIDITDTGHAYADIDNGDSGNLNSGDSGAAQILWAESGTGEKWAVVRLGSPTKSTAMFAVKVTQTSGSAGDASTLCTYVYTVKDLSGATLGTNKTPKKWRNSGAKRKMLKPFDDSIALAYYDASGVLQLFDANEVTAVTTC